jgi:hypothetical protein
MWILLWVELTTQIHEYGTSHHLFTSLISFTKVFYKLLCAVHSLQVVLDFCFIVHSGGY